MKNNMKSFAQKLKDGDYRPKHNPIIANFNGTKIVMTPKTPMFEMVKIYGEYTEIDSIEGLNGEEEALALHEIVNEIADKTKGGEPY
jgi:hypothetical protein